MITIKKERQPQEYIKEFFNDFEKFLEKHENRLAVYVKLRKQ